MAHASVCFDSLQGTTMPSCIRLQSSKVPVDYSNFIHSALRNSQHCSRQSCLGARIPAHTTLETSQFSTSRVSHSPREDRRLFQLQRSELQSLSCIRGDCSRTFWGASTSHEGQQHAVKAGVSRSIGCGKGRALYSEQSRQSGSYLETMELNRRPSDPRELTRRARQLQSLPENQQHSTRSGRLTCRGFGRSFSKGQGCGKSSDYTLGRVLEKSGEGSGWWDAKAAACPAVVRLK